MTSRGYKGRLVRSTHKLRELKEKLSHIFSTSLNLDTPSPDVKSVPDPDTNTSSPSYLPFPSSYEDNLDVSMSNLYLQSMPHDSKEPFRMKILEPPRSKTSQGTVSCNALYSMHHLTDHGDWCLQSSAELMQSWSEDKWPSYLAHIVHQEELGSPTYEGCHRADAGYHCLDCLGCPRLCKDCCRIGHRRNPFHKIEVWSGGHWTPAWLWHVGVIITLGHGQEPCPKYEASMEQLEARLISVNTPGFNQDNSYGARPKKRTIGCGEVVCFLHNNGFHYLPVYSCWCSDSVPEDLQYLDRSFYPASWKSVRTALTFTVLKDFDLFKIHGHMSTEMYLEILCHLTNEMFPSHSPVRL